MDCLTLLKKYFPDEEAFTLIRAHSESVAKKAIMVAEALHDPCIDIKFIREAALLHDIGICRTASPRIHCHGQEPYIRHGIVGREILEAEGLPDHALVCERHIGVGLSIEDIIRQGLPLPHREMLPVSREERIICFADLFYSKSPGMLTWEKTPAEVRAGLAGFGEHKATIFDGWEAEFRSSRE